MASKNKKAFDLGRDSVYVADPITQLRIMGGRGILDADESGDLDTEATPDMPVRDLKRLRRPLPIPFRKGIRRLGVKTPIIIAKIGDVAVVLEGKSRVRAARAANREREEAGEPLLTLRCVTQRDTSARALVETMIISNSARMDDDFSDKLEKLGQMKDEGVSDEDCAEAFMVKPVTIKGWLQYADNATDATKAAVKEGRLGPAAAADLARIKDPDEQREKLEAMLVAPDPKARSLKAAKKARGATGRTVAPSSKRELGVVLAFVQKMEHPKGASHAHFWEGVEETLKLMMGAKGIDDRLKPLMAV